MAAATMRVPGRSCSCPRRGHHLVRGSDVPKGKPGSTPTCSQPGCSSPALSRGWCNMHYGRWKIHGDVNWEPVTPEQLFWRQVDKSAGPNGCWMWTGYLDKRGYGESGSKRAHRRAYEWIVGPIPCADDGTPLSLDHLCHNADPECREGDSCLHRRCVNPAHLEPVPLLVNWSRGKAHGTETHCPQGHPYDEANTYHWLGNGKQGRICRRCHAEHERHRRERRRLEGRG